METEKYPAEKTAPAKPRTVLPTETKYVEKSKKQQVKLALTIYFNPIYPSYYHFSTEATSR